ncbi:DUF2306 domain-containing protein [Glycomyces xiaoerkulensis]|uniref:DUF2306 domain-containing protein n=1 Tax=Glycomyces xiaoerkulensis TaxID=2038139 RepID=UPI000C265F62|nr:DUF2306 domain-containing protein [Glycomyces xiaoerkulensis]
MTALTDSKRPTGNRRGRIAAVVVAVLSVGIALWAVPRYLVPGAEPRIEYRDDVAVHLPILSFHAATGGLALILGPFQFFRGIRRRHPKVHRAIGRTYLLAGVLPGSLSGIVVALLTTAGPIAMTAWVMLDVAWFYSAYRAFGAVRAGRIAEHERWMMRNMAFTFAGVTLRAYLGLFIGLQIPLLGPVYSGDFESLFATAYTGAAVASFLCNWMFIEIYLRRRRTAAPGPA